MCHFANARLSDFKTRCEISHARIRFSMPNSEQRMRVCEESFLSTVLVNEAEVFGTGSWT